MKILITGHQGFIGKNLALRLSELSHVEIVTFGREGSVSDLREYAKSVDVIVHLAGENRPKDSAEFERVNTVLTRELCNAVKESGRNIRILFASSAQADLDNPYGKSKRDAESILSKLAAGSSNTIVIYRLPNVFGKWCKPNYNSVVATFCHNISQDIPIQINDPATMLNLVYVDDVIADFISQFESKVSGANYRTVEPSYSITLGALADQIQLFQQSRQNLVTESVGSGLTRALYSTYMSYLKPAQFAYDLIEHKDDRGVFVEMLKTQHSGQMSYFTAKPGITRGGHYHHSKTEKFLVISGQAKFGFRHMLTNEKFELTTSGIKPQIVETIPGWAHDIKNIGDDELVVMLWANEIFDRELPDTIASKV